MRRRDVHLPAVRRRAIAGLLAQREFVTIEEILATTGTSSSTAHRDLEALAAAGVLHRIRGGARRRSPSPQDAELRSTLVQLRRTLDADDLDAVERALRRALGACERARHRP